MTACRLPCRGPWVADRLAATARLRSGCRHGASGFSLDLTGLWLRRRGRHDRARDRPRRGDPVGLPVPGRHLGQHRRGGVRAGRGGVVHRPRARAVAAPAAGAAVQPADQRAAPGRRGHAGPGRRAGALPAAAGPPAADLHGGPRGPAQDHGGADRHGDQPAAGRRRQPVPLLRLRGRTRPRAPLLRPGRAVGADQLAGARPGAPGRPGRPAGRRRLARDHRRGALVAGPGRLRRRRPGDRPARPRRRGEVAARPGRDPARLPGRRLGPGAGARRRRDRGEAARPRAGQLGRDPVRRRVARGVPAHHRLLRLLPRPGPGRGVRADHPRGDGQRRTGDHRRALPAHLRRRRALHHPGRGAGHGPRPVRRPAALPPGGRPGARVRRAPLRPPVAPDPPGRARHPPADLAARAPAPSRRPPARPGGCSWSATTAPAWATCPG